MDCEATSILFPDKKLIVVVIYGNFVSFLEIVEKILNNINIVYNVCVCGDFNAKFNTSNHQTNSLIELLSCYGFSQTIFGSTRGTNCLDNVFLNFSKENYKSEIIKVCFLNHDCQKVRMSVPEKSSNVIKRQMIRPLLNIGFHRMHNILSSLE